MMGSSSVESLIGSMIRWCGSSRMSGWWDLEFLIWISVAGYVTVMMVEWSEITVLNSVLLSGKCIMGRALLGRWWALQMRTIRWQIAWRMRQCGNGIAGGYRFDGLLLLLMMLLVLLTTNAHFLIYIVDKWETTIWNSNIKEILSHTFVEFICLLVLLSCCCSKVLSSKQKLATRMANKVLIVHILYKYTYLWFDYLMWFYCSFVGLLDVDLCVSCSWFLEICKQINEKKIFIL